MADVNANGLGPSRLAMVGDIQDLFHIGEHCQKGTLSIRRGEAQKRILTSKHTGIKLMFTLQVIRISWAGFHLGR